jgi:putative membrane protein
VNSPDFVSHLLAALVYAVVGIVILVLGFVLVDRLTPGSMWQELMEKQNVALGVAMAGIAIGLSIVIAAAIV